MTGGKGGFTDICRVAAAKSALRQSALARRASLDPALGATLVRLADHPWLSGTVGGFWPIGHEIDIRPLLHALIARGRAVALPETPPGGLPLIFRRWTPDTSMIAERFGTSRPDGPKTTPSVLLVPLLAFDRRGHRLGYGGGYYDRTLAALAPIRAIGVAYAAQEVDEVPVEPHDRCLDAIATETELIVPHPA